MHPALDQRTVDLERLGPAELRHVVDDLGAFAADVLGCAPEALAEFIRDEEAPSTRARFTVVRNGGRLVAFTYYRMVDGTVGTGPGMVYEYVAAASEPVGSGAAGLGPVLRDALGYKLVHPRANIGIRASSLQLWRLARAGVVHFPVRALRTDGEIREQLARLGRSRLRPGVAA